MEGTNPAGGADGGSMTQIPIEPPLHIHVWRKPSPPVFI